MQEWTSVMVTQPEISQVMEDLTNSKPAWTFWAPPVWAGTVQGEPRFLLIFNRTLSDREENDGE